MAVWLTDPDARRADFTGTITAWGCLNATANGAISYPLHASCGTVFWHEATDPEEDGGYVLIDGCGTTKTRSAARSAGCRGVCGSSCGRSQDWGEIHFVF